MSTEVGSLSALKPEGGVVHYDGGESAIFDGDNMKDPSYWVEMSIDPNEGYIPDIRAIKRAIDDHIDNANFHNPEEKDEYIYDLIRKLVGDYISNEMIMRLST